MTPAASNFPANHRVRALIYLLVILASAAFALIRPDFSMFLLTATVGAVAWIVVEGRGTGVGKAVPKIVVNASIAVAALYLWYQISDTSKDRNLILCLGQFVVALMICKLLERKSPRDLVQLVILSLVVVVASTMFSSSILFALILITYFVLLVYAIVMLNLYTEALSVISVEHAPLLTPRQEEVPGFIRDIRRLATQCSLLLIPIAMLLFLCMPRARNSSTFLAQWGMGGTFQTGFNENVQFHDYGSLNESDAVAMEVRLTENGQDKGSEMYEPYFRGRVLDGYDPARKTWYHAGTRDNTITITEAANLLPDDAELPPNVLTQDYTLHGPGNRYLFTIVPPISFSSNFRNVTYDPSTVTFALPGSGGRNLSYRVASLLHSDSTTVIPPKEMPASYPNPRFVPFDPTSSDDRVEQRLPREVVRGVSPIAMEVVKDSLPQTARELTRDDVQRIVERLEFYLRSNYTYSLEFGQVDPTLDPTVDFLINRKKTGGHCEYFASAMVMMCRTLGLPARMVTGYKGGEYNSVGGYYIVRQKHAHAWAEVLVPNVGWVESDPSPIEVSYDASQGFVKQWFRELTQFLQNLWLGTVIGFDNDSRTLLMMRLTDVWDRYTQPIRDLGGTLKYLATAPQVDAGIRMSFFLSAAGILLMGLWLVRRWYLERRVARQIVAFRKGAKMSPETQFLDELLRLLVRQDLTSRMARAPYQTPREFVESAAAPLGAAQADAMWLVQTFYGLQFGGIHSTGEMRGEIGRSLERVREAIRERHHKSPRR